MSDWNGVQRRVERVRKFAQLLDDKYTIPGTGIRFGLDALVGLIPGAGDAATAAAGLWLIVEASRLGVPKAVLARMVVNLIADSAIGAIPLVGDAIDLFFKSNRRNAKLLEEHLKQQYPSASE